MGVTRYKTRIAAFIKDHREEVELVALSAVAIVGTVVVAVATYKEQLQEEADAAQARHELFEMYADAREYRRLQNTSDQ